MMVIVKNFLHDLPSKVVGFGVLYENLPPENSVLTIQWNEIGPHN